MDSKWPFTGLMGTEDEGRGLLCGKDLRGGGRIGSGGQKQKSELKHIKHSQGKSEKGCPESYGKSWDEKDKAKIAEVGSKTYGGLGSKRGICK